MATPSVSRLDLTGQASEDEHPLRTQLQPLQLDNVAASKKNESDNERRRREDRSPSQRQQTSSSSARRSNNSDGASSDEGPNTMSNAHDNNIFVQFLPCPIDLWHAFTPTSLLLLPFVFIIFAILQLPLNTNSKSTPQPMSNAEWQGRARDVDDLSRDLRRVERELNDVKGDHREVRGKVSSLRQRLGRMNARTEEREKRLKKASEERRKEEEMRQKLLQQGGVAKEGPIATVSTFRAMDVPTFAGDPKDSSAKKER